MIKKMFFYSLGIFFSCLPLFSQVLPGVDVFFKENYHFQLKGKKIGIVTNHTGVDSKLHTTVERFIENAKNYEVVAFFSPEHGFQGNEYAGDKIKNSKISNIPVFSLHGSTRKPTEKMLQNIDVLIFDIQCIGSRSYTYTTTLFYVMEAAAKKGISVIVLDRPNPMGGLIVDGPMLEEKFRSFLGYINVPYCHGMTIGELANLFNKEYKIGCKLEVIPMQGWRRSMTYKDTGLSWVPPSPHIPEPDTPLFYPTTGILGELQILNIGVGYTLPFKIVGAPWIDAKEFASKLNAQKLKGVVFVPFYFRPFYGIYKGEDCKGIMIQITDYEKYRPVETQYLLLGILKSLYPDKFLESLDRSESSKKLFSRVNGTEEVYNILKNEKYATWKLIEFNAKERAKFMNLRKEYLNPEYSN